MSDFWNNSENVTFSCNAFFFPKGRHPATNGVNQLWLLFLMKFYEKFAHFSSTVGHKNSNVCIFPGWVPIWQSLLKQQRDKFFLWQNP
jgi:hypothetical protein